MCCNLPLGGNNRYCLMTLTFCFSKYLLYISTCFFCNPLDDCKIISHRIGNFLYFYDYAVAILCIALKAKKYYLKQSEKSD